MKKASLEQVKQLLELLTGSSRKEIQKLLGAGDLLQFMLKADLQAVDRTAFQNLLQATSYDDEIMESDYSYPDGYTPRNVVEQVEVLSEFYPDLDFDQVQELTESWGKLPKGAEHLLVCPKLSAVGERRKIADPLGTGYSGCLKHVLGHLDSTHKFDNYFRRTLTKSQVRLFSSTRKTLKRLEHETPGDCLVVPINSGRFYAGYSVCAARWEIKHNRWQWAAPIWLVAHHLLTNPDRFSTGNELRLDCPGDEYSMYADDRFESCLYFNCHGQALSLYYGGISNPDFRYGSVVAFSRERN